MTRNQEIITVTGMAMWPILCPVLFGIQNNWNLSAMAIGFVWGLLCLPSWLMICGYLFSHKESK